MGAGVKMQKIQKEVKNPVIDPLPSGLYLVIDPSLLSEVKTCRGF